MKIKHSKVGRALKEKWEPLKKTKKLNSAKIKKKEKKKNSMTGIKRNGGKKKRK